MASQQQGPPRAPSPPRHEPPRQYQDSQPQRPPPPPHRGLSTSPKGPQPGPAPFHQGPLHHPQQLPPQHASSQQGPLEPSRSAYGPQSSNAASSSNGMPGSASHTPLPPYPRQPELQPEIRPLVNHPAPSSSGPRTPFEHHPHAAPSIASGAPPPSSAQTAADAAARERDERPGSTAPPKRVREWDDDPAGLKKPSTEEARSRLDEIKMHRPSPPDKMATPPNRSPSELRRMDDQRPTSAYRPSEATHHVPALPSMHSMTQPSPSASVIPQDEQRAPPPLPSAPQPPPVYEPAARKMEVDENYDDSGDDRSATKQESQRNSPRAPAPAAAGAMEGPA